MGERIERIGMGNGLRWARVQAVPRVPRHEREDDEYEEREHDEPPGAPAAQVATPPDEDEPRPLIDIRA